MVAQRVCGGARATCMYIMDAGGAGCGCPPRSRRSRKRVRALTRRPARVRYFSRGLRGNPHNRRLLSEVQKRRLPVGQ
jgi:hypothetical protein